MATTANGTRHRENVVMQKVIFTLFAQLKMIILNKNYLEKICKWSRCVGDIHGPYACKNQFGNEWRQTSGKEKCGSITFKYECCNH